MSLLPEKDSAEYVWYVTLLLTLVNACNYMDRMALATLIPSIKAELSLSDAHLGLLTGFAFAVFYAICGIPIARWGDRGIRRNVIALALVTWSVMTALSGAAQNFWHLFLARIGVGAGEAGGPAPAGSLLCDYVPPNRRSLVFAIHGFGLNIGMVLGMALAGWLAETVGWRWTFVVLGIPGLALAGIVRLTLREPLRGRFDPINENETGLSFRKIIQSLYRHRFYRLLVLYLVANGFVQYGLNQWWPSYYVRIFDLDLSSVGAYLGVAIGVGSGLGTLAGGLLSSKMSNGDPRFPLKMSMVAIGAAVPPALGSLAILSVRESMTFVSLTIMMLNVPSGVIVSNIFGVVLPQMRATAGAVAMFATSLLGFGLGPFCVGIASDFLTPSFGAQSLRYALLVPIAVLPLLVVILHKALSVLSPNSQTADEPTERNPEVKLG